MRCETEEIAEHFFNPRNVGKASEPSFIGRAAALACGGSVCVSLQVDDSRRITEAKFKAAGCSVLVASASLLTEQIAGSTTADAAAVGQSPEVVASQLGMSGAQKNSCPGLACEALVSAIRQFSDYVRDEWTGDEALICTCFGVSERRIENEIQSAGLRNIEEITRACNAGAGCRSCYPLIQDIIDDHWQSLQSQS